MAVQQDVEAKTKAWEISASVLIHRSRRCFVVPLPANPEVGAMGVLCRGVIYAVGSETPEAVIFDASVMELMDSRIADQISRTASVLRLLGAQVILSGMPPELCTALIRLNVIFPALQKSGSLDYAFKMVEQGVRLEDK